MSTTTESPPRAVSGRDQPAVGRFRVAGPAVRRGVWWLLSAVVCALWIRVHVPSAGGAGALGRSQVLAAGVALVMAVGVGWRVLIDLGRERKQLRAANDALARKAAESALLYSFGRTLSAATSMDDLATEALEQIVRVTQADAAKLFLYQRDAEEVALVAGVGVPDDFDLSIQRQSVCPEATGVAARAAYTREMVLVADLWNSAEFPSRAELARRYQFRSLLAEPLIARGELVGVLQVVTCTPRAFAEEELRLIRGLANDFALSLENVRLAEEAQDRARMERLVNRISARIQGTLDLQTVMETATREVAIAAGASRCLILRGQEEGRLATAHEYCQPGVRSVIGVELPATSISGEALESGKTVRCDDVRHDPRFDEESRKAVLALGTNAILATALHHRGRTVGVLSLHECERPRQWRAADAALLEAVAGQIAIGLENAYLYQETRRKSDEIAAKNRELEAFVYTASHDLRSPLVTIQAFASILLAENAGSLDEEGRFYLERIRVNTERMERLINDLLELSRAGRVAGPFEDVNIGEAVSEVLDALHVPLQERGVAVGMPDTWPTLRCHRARIAQVFANLVGNAVKFLGPENEHPRIELGWEDDGDFVEFFVSDNGIGIDPEYHERVFIVFQRLNELTEVEGTGIGLAIVKRIVDVHGGRIWVESAKGKGATFRFALPRRQENA